MINNIIYFLVGLTLYKVTAMILLVTAVGLCFYGIAFAVMRPNVHDIVIGTGASLVGFFNARGLIKSGIFNE